MGSPRPATASRRWLPHQHGAWAMLAVPFLIGVAASALGPWQLVLAGASVAGYLASATAQSALRARHRAPFVVPLGVYAAAFGALALALVAAFPGLLLTLAVLGPATALIVTGAKPGTRRDLANSLGQVVQALVLVPSAAWVSGTFDAGRVALATGVSAAYLLGTVLVVRSVLRERSSRTFTAFSTAFHGLLAVAAVLLGPAWVVLAIGLAVRAAALPSAARRLNGTPRALKPVHVGAVEAVAAVAVVATAFLAFP